MWVPLPTMHIINGGFSVSLNIIFGQRLVIWGGLVFQKPATAQT
jgi:hypothetical protein